MGEVVRVDFFGSRHPVQRDESVARKTDRKMIADAINWLLTVREIMDHYKQPLDPPERAKMLRITDIIAGLD